MNTRKSFTRGIATPSTSKLKSESSDISGIVSGEGDQIELLIPLDEAFLIVIGHHPEQETRYPVSREGRAVLAAFVKQAIREATPEFLPTFFDVMKECLPEFPGLQQ